ncbi:MAG: DUF192 domain-containing protein [Candidatus Chisholmbacteria bacterium]|nr:DUF192 domain-containing protein [Candidatus Chisholmbacteria bacterium]
MTKLFEKKLVKVGVLAMAIVLLLAVAMLSVVSILPERRACFVGHKAASDLGCVLVAVAQTDRERQRGLGGVRWLPDMLGMLFVFSEPSYHSFWMKGMRIPLDFVWLRDGRVVDLNENVYPETAEEKRWTIYKPMLPADMVLEVAAGWVKRRNLKVGDRLFW